jgi:PIN domain nuclease of toxin-antitoxin system
MSVVLDTNALIWLLKDSDRLGRRAERRIDEAFRNSRVIVSATSFWEVAVLVAKGRIDVGKPTDQWRLEALELGIEEAPIDGEIAVRSVALSGLHADPADRFIAATAIRLNAPLVTADANLLVWKGPLVCIDARV